MGVLTGIHSQLKGGSISCTIIDVNVIINELDFYTTVGEPRNSLGRFCQRGRMVKQQLANHVESSLLLAWSPLPEVPLVVRPSITDAMSHTSDTTSCLHYQSILDHALVAYKKKTGKDLHSHPLLSKLATCDSPDTVLNTLREQIPAFAQTGSSRELQRSFHKMARSDGERALCVLRHLWGLRRIFFQTYPPAGVIFSAIGVLFSTVKAVDADKSILVNLFERIESFFRRLEAYIAIPSIAGMKNTMVRIMAEVLSILALATKEMTQTRATTFLKKLTGRSEIEDSLQRLDKLTQEESWMAAAQGLRATHCVEVQITEGVERIKQEITDGFGGLNWDRLRQDIRTWLSPPDPSMNFNTASDARHEGTATWFTQSNTFSHWNEASSLLWIHGKPGSGKSVLASAIIHHIRATSNVALAHISYFFFDFKDTGKQDARALLSSILVQLSNQSDSFCDILLALYSAHHQGSQQPSDSELILCLEAMLGVPGQIPIYIIIDALDECPMTTGMSSPRRKVLALIEILVDSNSPNLRLCITSRPEIDIRNCLEPLKPTRVSLHDENGQKQDIFDFVRKEVYSDINMRKWRDDDKILVIEMLSERADGFVGLPVNWKICGTVFLPACGAFSPSYQKLWTKRMSG
ncbi:hypothetical protein F5148DRAFT_195910 [Russula earlei]|uniref:Uncharacterized protein n=1 Tax=Russula earlei TaxID=71964 RepID=A0ACC0U6G9_9AGAM|nr:hypothetical protein F5148DRAFT_195910 [Russula earlei]